MKFIGIWLLILVPFIEIWGYFKLQTTADGSKREREGRDEGRKRY
jgi:hypothetical protein